MNDNKKRINNEQELFELFCDPYSNRKQLQKPYYEKSTKTVYATDGRVVILMNPNVTSLSYEEIDFPLIGNLIKGAGEEFFTLDSLKKTLASFEMEEEQVLTEEMEECEECKGSGEVEWIYIDIDGKTHYRYFDCPVCDGKGGAEGVFESTGFMIPTDDSIVRIGKLFFRGIVAQKLLWAMEYFNVDKAAFAEGENSISITLNNGVEIAIASLEPFAFQNIVTLETTMQTN